MKLPKADLEELAEKFRTNAQTADREALFWRNRALAAEPRFAAQDARERADEPHRFQYTERRSESND